MCSKIYLIDIIYLYKLQYSSLIDLYIQGVLKGIILLTGRRKQLWSCNSQVYTYIIIVLSVYHNCPYEHLEIRNYKSQGYLI